MTQKLLTPQEVAAYLGVPLATLYRWSYRREGPRPIRVGRHLRYREVDLEKWLDNRAQTREA